LDSSFFHLGCKGDGALLGHLGLVVSPLHRYLKRRSSKHWISQILLAQKRNYFARKIFIVLDSGSLDYVNGIHSDREWPFKGLKPVLRFP